MIYDDRSPLSPEPDDQGRRPTVVVASAGALRLRIRGVEHPSIPEAAVGIGTFIGDRLLGRQAVAPETVPTYRALLSRPRRLAYIAYETDDGSVEGQLAAVVRPSEVVDRGQEADEGIPEEAWKQSVPSFEAGADDEEDVGDDEHAALLPLGLVVRMAQRRSFPGDLAAEAADVLKSVVEKGAVEIVDQFLDTL